MKSSSPIPFQGRQLWSYCLVVSRIISTRQTTTCLTLSPHHPTTPPHHHHPPHQPTTIPPPPAPPPHHLLIDLQDRTQKLLPSRWQVVPNPVQVNPASLQKLFKSTSGHSLLFKLKMKFPPIHRKIEDEWDMTEIDNEVNRRSKTIAQKKKRPGPPRIVHGPSMANPWQSIDNPCISHEFISRVLDDLDNHGCAQILCSSFERSSRQRRSRHVRYASAPFHDGRALQSLIFSELHSGWGVPFIITVCFTTNNFAFNDIEHPWIKVDICVFQLISIALHGSIRTSIDIRVLTNQSSSSSWFINMGWGEGIQ